MKTYLTLYVYVNGKVAYEKRGDKQLYLWYDSYGNLAALRYFQNANDENGVLVYATTNARGDVVGLYTGSGTQCVWYEYDSWGNLVDMTDLSGVGIGTINPIRYRGYYYDTETGLYYCNSRYYDSEIGRFISADTTDILTATPTGLTDKNLFAYCDNNPVIRSDNGGQFWHIVAGAVIGAVIGGVSKLITNAIERKENIWDGVLVSTLTGAASGALAATGVGLIGQVVGGAAIAMVGSATQQTIDILQNEKESFDVNEMLMDGAVGAACGLVGGAGASQGNSKTAMTLGVQVTKRVFVKHELVKGLAYYGKNMMNGAGKSIYKSLSTALFRSGFTGLFMNSSRSFYSSYKEDIHI